MRIVVDGRHLLAGRGVARYTGALLAAMVEAFPGEDWRVFVPGREAVRCPVEPIRHRLGGRALFGAASVVGLPRLDRLAGGADVVWAPAPAPLAVSDVPLVLTVHDLSWVHLPRAFTPYERLWHRLARPRALARRAARVIAVSEATRADLLERWGLDPGRVTVVRSGPGLAAGVPHEATARGVPYFLAVGALEPRKAPELLARAHARAREAGLTAELVFVGDGRLAGALRGGGIRVRRGVDDDELRRLYTGALAVVHPAPLEGFAFPPAEGLAHGVPAIVADIPVHAETIGGGALRVPAGDEEALAGALRAMEGDPGLRERLARAGAEAIAGLSWEQAARATHAQLRLAAGGGR
jgi:glycosyltransferase involved in cell wall biosynthesis